MTKKRSNYLSVTEHMPFQSSNRGETKLKLKLQTSYLATEHSHV